MKTFYTVLANNLIAGITTNLVWFALVFWIYLATHSVMATAFVSGCYMLCNAVFSLVAGTLVDKHHKKRVMLAASGVTLVCYLLAGMIFLTVGEKNLQSLTSVPFWIFSLFLLIGAVVTNLRSIAVSTLVTLLVAKKERDKANGLVGAVNGVGFMVTSFLSGLAIGFLGMGYTIGIGVVLTIITLLHMLSIAISEKKIVHDLHLAGKHIDIKGSLHAIREVPGLGALMVFTVFNNFIGGVFMALMDPYGLQLFPVTVWGSMLALSSTGFIVGGIAVNKRGLGKNPLKTLLLINLAAAIVGLFFAVREIGLLFVFGMFVYMCLMPVAEAAEQTVLQRVVPFAKQGRVFGFGQSLESAASPLTAFAIGPLAEYWIIPYMKHDGQRIFQWLLGTGSARGIALIFMAASLIMIGATIVAFRSKAYKILYGSYKNA